MERRGKGRQEEEGGGKGMRRGAMESLIYAPDKKTRNSIRPPKSAPSIFVVRNVARSPPCEVQDGARTSGAHGLKNFPWDIS